MTTGVICWNHANLCFPTRPFLVAYFVHLEDEKLLNLLRNHLQSALFHGNAGTRSDLILAGADMLQSGFVDHEIEAGVKEFLKRAHCTKSASGIRFFDLRDKFLELG
jgi:hypothetical protein